MKLYYRPHLQAFAQAIKTGRLSRAQDSRWYVGNYMYMITYLDEASGLYIDEFKHCITRKTLNSFTEDNADLGTEIE